MSTKEPGSFDFTGGLMENKGLRGKEKTHKLLIETAITLFIQKKSANVSLDEVADSANIARRTLFYHFSNKEALVLEITEPIFFDGIKFLNTISKKSRNKTIDLINLFLFLWEKHELSLNLLYNIDFENFHTLENLHSKFLTKYMELINRIDDFPMDLENSKKSIASIAFRCFVPILSKVNKMDNYELRFTNIITGIITGMSTSALESDIITD